MQTGNPDFFQRSRKGKMLITHENRYYNQQAVKIYRYRTSNVQAINGAMRTLTGSAFKMYMYLMNFHVYETILFSQVHFTKITGLSEQTYYLCKKELTMRGYLEKQENGDFLFFSDPRFKEELLAQEQMSIYRQKKRSEEKDMQMTDDGKEEKPKKRKKKK